MHEWTNERQEITTNKRVISFLLLWSILSSVMPSFYKSSSLKDPLSKEERNIIQTIRTLLRRFLGDGVFVDYSVFGNTIQIEFEFPSQLLNRVNNITSSDFESLRQYGIELDVNRKILRDAHSEERKYKAFLLFIKNSTLDRSTKQQQQQRVLSLRNGTITQKDDDDDDDDDDELETIPPSAHRLKNKKLSKSKSRDHSFVGSTYSGMLKEYYCKFAIGMVLIFIVISILSSLDILMNHKNEPIVY